jgi:hypothetical protein
VHQAADAEVAQDLEQDESQDARTASEGGEPSAGVTDQPHNQTVVADRGGHMAALSAPPFRATNIPFPAIIIRSQELTAGSEPPFVVQNVVVNFEFLSV